MLFGNTTSFALSEYNFLIFIFPVINILSIYFNLQFLKICENSFPISIKKLVHILGG